MLSFIFKIPWTNFSHFKNRASVGCFSLKCTVFLHEHNLWVEQCCLKLLTFQYNAFSNSYFWMATYLLFIYFYNYLIILFSFWDWSQARCGFRHLGRVAPAWPQQETRDRGYSCLYPLCKGCPRRFLLSVAGDKTALVARAVLWRVRDIGSRKKKVTKLVRDTWNR